MVLRNLDNHSVYTVEGEPFYGRFTFFKLHTTEKITIYDEDETPLDNPMLSDDEGRTSKQVFLPDEDVTVLLEKYVGSGNMSDDMDNISSWSESYTFDSLKNTVVIDIGDGTVIAGAAGNITALRNMDISAVNYAILRGYNELGDMPPVYYKLEYDPSAHDNGGSVVGTLDTTMFWKLITPQFLDIRVFGVFPTNSYTTASARQSAFFDAFRYANAMGIAVYMPAVYEEGGYYAIEGGDHVLNQTLYLDTGTHLVAKTGTENSLTVDKIEGAATGFFYYHNDYNTGKLTLNVKTCRSSWLNTWAQNRYFLNPTDEIIIDTNIGRTGQTFADLQRVYISKENFSPAGTIIFDGIQNFESPGNISLNAFIQFKNMTEIKDSWWALSDSAHKIDTSKVTLTGCTYYMHDFTYPENYCILANADGIKTFNLEGRTYNASITDVYADTTWINGEVSSLNLSGNVTFRNIKGSVYNSGTNAWNNLTIEDSYINGSLPFSIMGSVYVKSSSFTSTQSVSSSLPFFNGATCTIRDSIFYGYSIQIPYNAIITGCTFAPNDLGARTIILAYNSATDGKLSITFTNNVLDKAKLLLTPKTALHPITVYGSTFVNNAITDSYDGTNFINWNQSYMNTTGHSYTYRNNDGPDVLQNEAYAVLLKDVPVWFNNGGTPPSRIYIEYTGPHEIYAGTEIPIVTGGTIVNGVWIPTYSKSEVSGSYMWKSRLVGLTIQDLGLFCFALSDFDNKYVAYSGKSTLRAGDTDSGKLLSTNVSYQGQGFPSDLTPSAGASGQSSNSAATVPVPYAYCDVWINSTITKLGTIN